MQSFRSFRGSFNHNGRPSARSKLRIAYINFCSLDGQMLSTPKYTALAPLRKDASIWPSQSTRSGWRAATCRRHGGRKCTEIFLENTIHGMKFLSSSGPLRSRSDGRELSSPIHGDKSLETCRLVWIPRNQLRSHLNRGVSVAGIAARAGLAASRPEMAPQRLEKIESAPGNGMGSEASNLQHLVRERAADRALRRIVSDRRLRPSGHSSRIRSAGRPMGNFPPRNPLKSLKTGKELEAPTAQWPRSTNSTREKAARKSCRKRRLTL